MDKNVQQIFWEVNIDNVRVKLIGVGEISTIDFGSAKYVVRCAAPLARSRQIKTDPAQPAVF